MPLLAFALLAGCMTESGTAPDVVVGPVFKPANVHTAAPELPATVRKVAVLPLITDLSNSTGEHGLEMMEPVVQAELLQARQFEMTFVPRERLRQWLGRESWSADAPLPPLLFSRLHAEFQCDAVLFVRLTTYRAYPPLALGWNARLVDRQGRTIWWAADEVFDAGEPAVANAARLYYQAHARDQAPLKDSRSLLLSPRQFGQYTMHALLSTLPPRAAAAVAIKVLPRATDK